MKPMGELSPGCRQETSLFYAAISLSGQGAAVSMVVYKEKIHFYKQLFFFSVV